MPNQTVFRGHSNGHAMNGYGGHGMNGFAVHNGHAAFYSQNGHTAKANGHASEYSLLFTSFYLRFGASNPLNNFDVAQSNRDSFVNKRGRENVYFSSYKTDRFIGEIGQLTAVSRSYETG